MRLSGVGVDDRVSVQAVTSKIVALAGLVVSTFAVVIARASKYLPCMCL